MARIYNESRYYSAIATNDLTGKAGYAVALNTSSGHAGEVVLANAQTLPTIGILSVEGVAGQRVTVVLPQMGTAVAIYGGTVAVGDKLTPDSNGKLITTTTNKDQVVAIAKEAGSAGEYHEVVLMFFTLSA